LEYGVSPNRIIVLTAKDSLIIERGEKYKYQSDNIGTPGISKPDDVGKENESLVTVHSVLDGYKQNIEGISKVLSDGKASGCGVCQFDVGNVGWEKILELAYDFITQPLPKK